MKSMLKPLQFIIFLTLYSTGLLAAGPSQINYQGLLADSNGNPISGNRTISVKLFNTATGGTPIYEETIGSVNVVNGIYSFQFGAVGNGIASTLTGSENYLAVYVNSVEQLPRTKILAVPFALKSADAQALSTQVATLSSNLTTVQGQTDTLSSNVTTLKTQTANMSSMIGSLGSNVTALKNQNTLISGNLSAVQNQANALSSNTSAIQSRLSELGVGFGWLLARDYDGDGVNDYREIIDGTNPNDPASFNPLSKGLVAYYPFNGNSKDESGNGNDILINNSNISFDKNRFGSLNAAIKFNNNQAYAVSKRNSGITGNQAHSYSFWVNLAKIPEWSKGEGSILQLGTFPESGAGQASQIFIDDRQGTGVRIVAEGGYADLEALNIQTNLVNSWHNVIYVYTRSVSGSKIYLDGVLLNGTPWDGGNAVDELNLPDAPVQIGVGNQGSGMKSIEGSISDIRIYNRALTADEVTQLYIKESGLVTVQGGNLPQSSGLAGQSVSTFQIAKYETTWGEWKSVREWAVSNGYTDLAGVGDTYPSGSSDNFPVVNVSWYDVVKWSNAKSEREGLTPVYTVNGTTYKTGESVPTVNSTANGYRLPSEKEWEWTARGGVSSQGYTYSGSNDLNAVAWTNANSSDGTKAVGTKGANELEIYDMTGNVWEWCVDPVGSTYRRIRGGSWNYAAAFGTVAHRGFNDVPGFRKNEEIGFRLARNAGN